MKFYLCQTADGPRLSPTQAAARQLDPNFETIELADDKDGRIAHINGLFAQIAGAAPRGIDNPAEVVEDDQVEVQAAERTAVASKPGNGSLDWQSAPEAGSCRRCIGMSEAARSIETIMAVTNIEHAIHSADVPSIERIQEALVERRKKLQA